MPKRVDITGKRFGMLVAIERTDQKDKRGLYLWRCKCDCGNECFVTSSRLSGGQRVSCGCRKYAYRDKGRSFFGNV